MSKARLPDLIFSGICHRRAHLRPKAGVRTRRLLEIDSPLYFQISREGLAAPNDYIRGKAHFHRSPAFLDGLGELDNLTDKDPFRFASRPITGEK
ncbi:MAG: hypothetical protein KQI81_00330 [Deltaproteobacteria bacterium]|nr:hypothetical protein [Deltaproteobacteria bacterium]